MIAGNGEIDGEDGRRAIDEFMNFVGERKFTITYLGGSAWAAYVNRSRSFLRTEPEDVCLDRTGAVRVAGHNSIQDQVMSLVGVKECRDRDFQFAGQLDSIETQKPIRLSLIDKHGKMLRMRWTSLHLIGDIKKDSIPYQPFTRVAKFLGKRLALALKWDWHNERS
jgi:hypothetical protein